MTSSSFPGLGLRPSHYPHLEDHKSASAKWFEAISENYMDTYGRPRQMLRKIRKDYDLALHGVSMSLASSDGLNEHYLKSLKILVDELEPIIVSDHLCFTRVGKHYLHDLYPIPYNKEMLEILVQNVDCAQNFLGRNILLENASTYFSFVNSDCSESEFLVSLCRKTGAKILLDINNIYVNAVNQEFNPRDYLEQIPPQMVGQIHLAGFTDTGKFYFDTHSRAVCSEVWELFSFYIKSCPQVPFMIEWDEDIPSFPELETELNKAIAIWDARHGTKD
ncbi:MAG: DUF692 domain-containing protein [Oligoflexales bacterium]